MIAANGYSLLQIGTDALVMAIAALAPLLGYAPQMLHNMLIVARRIYLDGLTQQQLLDHYQIQPVGRHLW